MSKIASRNFQVQVALFNTSVVPILANWLTRIRHSHCQNVAGRSRQSFLLLLRGGSLDSQNKSHSKGTHINKSANSAIVVKQLQLWIVDSNRATFFSDLIDHQIAQVNTLIYTRIDRTQTSCENGSWNWEKVQKLKWLAKITNKTVSLGVLRGALI